MAAATTALLHHEERDEEPNGSIDGWILDHEEAATRIQAAVRGFLVRRWFRAKQVVLRLSAFPTLLNEERNDYVRKRRSIPKLLLLERLESRLNTRLSFGEARVFGVFLVIFIVMVLLQQNPAMQYKTETGILNQVLNGGNQLQYLQNLVTFDEIVDLNGFGLWLNNTMIPATFRPTTSVVLADGTSVILPAASLAIRTANTAFLLDSMGIDNKTALKVTTDYLMPYVNTTYPGQLEIANGSQKVKYVENPAAIATFNKVIGGVLITRHQAVPKRCDTKHTIIYGQQCFSAHDYMPKQETMLWYIYDQALSQAVVTAMLGEMTHFAGKVDLVFATFNPNAYRVVYLHLTVTFNAAGLVKPDTSLLTSTCLESKKENMTAYLMATILFAFYLAFTAYFAFLAGQRLWLDYKVNQNIWLYFWSTWTWIEWLTLGMSWVYTVAFLVFRLKLLPSLKIFDDQMNLILIAKGDIVAIRHMWDEIRALSKFAARNISIAAFSIMLYFAKMVHLFRFEGKISQVARTLCRSAGDIWHFGIVFLLFLLAFAIAGSVQFGHSTNEFTTLEGAAVTLFRMAVGTADFFDDMTTFDPIIGVVFFCLFQSIVALILLNIFIAIVLDAFLSVRKDPENVISLVDEVEESILRRREALRDFLLAFKHGRSTGDNENPHASRPTLVKKAQLEELVEWLHRYKGDTITQHLVEKELGPLSNDVQRLVKGIQEVIELEERLRGGPRVHGKASEEDDPGVIPQELGRRNFILTRLDSDAPQKPPIDTLRPCTLGLVAHHVPP